jgi:hypothetical protein
MYPTLLSQIIVAASRRIEKDLQQAYPTMAPPILAWLRHLAGDKAPADYFTHPLAFPSLLLPWWLEASLPSDPDLEFQAGLVTSTMNGYYHIRLIDNLMDGHATVELKLLPALNFFHTRFQAVYHTYFPADHAFWPFFQTLWFRSGEVAMADAAIRSIDQAAFVEIAAQKICAAKIPLAAVCYRYNRPELIKPWSDLVDLLGAWHQFFNDLSGWPEDARNGAVTYFLSEAERRRHAKEPLVSWVAREGFDWAIETLAAWMLALTAQAKVVNSSACLAYLNLRQMMLLERVDEIKVGLQTLAKLAKLGSE